MYAQKELSNLQQTPGSLGSSISDSSFCAKDHLGAGIMGTLGKHWNLTEKTKRRMSKTRLKRKERLGYINSSKTKENISKAMQGRKLSKEHIRKICKFGEESAHWKGGRIRVGEYIYIYKPKHPFCNNLNYIAEHRLVMEKYLGRYLSPEEKVHHENKIKSDNRIENLKLFADESIHQRYHRFKEIEK